MSTDHSDSRGSRETPVLTSKIPDKPPFKVWFPKHQMNGRSDVGVSKVDGDYLFI